MGQGTGYPVVMWSPAITPQPYGAPQPTIMDTSTMPHPTRGTDMWQDHTSIAGTGRLGIIEAIQ